MCVCVFLCISKKDVFVCVCQSVCVYHPSSWEYLSLCSGWFWSLEQSLYREACVSISSLFMIIPVIVFRLVLEPGAEPIQRGLDETIVNENYIGTKKLYMIIIKLIFTFLVIKAFPLFPFSFNFPVFSMVDMFFLGS